MEEAPTGIALNLWLYRRRHMGSVVLAHAVANAAIFAFVVTRASAVIPSVPLYISLLYRVMKDKGLHENCIQQMYRLFHDFLYSPRGMAVDAKGRSHATSIICKR